MGGAVGAALLGADFDRRAAAVVLGITALPDLDLLAEPFVVGAHRTVGHNVFVPTIVLCVLLWDTRLRSRSWIRTRLGESGTRVAWVSLVSLVGAALLPDLAVGGVNLFYPLHDAFYSLDGSVFYSTTRGWVQTFVEASSGGPDRTTENFRFPTVLDPRATKPTSPAGAFTGTKLLFLIGLLSPLLVTVSLLWSTRVRPVSWLSRQFRAHRRRILGTSVAFVVGAIAVPALTVGTPSELGVLTEVEALDGARTPERVFPVAMTGYRFVVLLLSTFLAATRLWENERRAATGDPSVVEEAEPTRRL
jgi:hypothetical protein